MSNNFVSLFHVLYKRLEIKEFIIFDVYFFKPIFSLPLVTSGGGHHPPYDKNNEFLYF